MSVMNHNAIKNTELFHLLKQGACIGYLIVGWFLLFCSTNVEQTTSIVLTDCILVHVMEIR